MEDDYFEIDFLDVDSKRSGDAISIRHQVDGETVVMVVDGGFQQTGEGLVKHIRNNYDWPLEIDHVVVTHPDGDHAGGIRSVLESFEIGTLWMMRPWKYSQLLLQYFSRFSSVENLEKRLKDIYPNISTLEDIAKKNKISIEEPLQGKQIGPFTVLSPTLPHYLVQVIQSDKTPEAISLEEEDKELSLGVFVKKVWNYVKATWGEEVFSDQGTSSENEMSVVQYGTLCGDGVFLTADAGRESLKQASDYAEKNGIDLKILTHFQVPHHGSRRNVSTDVLDRILGPRLSGKPQVPRFTAIISASKEDKDHPRKAVIRACYHRGGTVISTEGNSIRTASLNAPRRDNWGPCSPLGYPEDQEK